MGQFWYGVDGPVPLTVDTLKAVLAFEAGIPEWRQRELLQSVSRIAGVDRSEPVVDGFLVCDLVTGTGYDLFLDSLAALEGIALVEPYYRSTSGYGNRVGATILVAFRQVVSNWQVDSLAGAFGLTVDEGVSSLSRVVRLRNSGQSRYRLLDLANFLHGLPQVLFAHPDFVVMLENSAYRLYDYYHDRQPHLKKVIGTFNTGPTVWDFAGVTRPVTVAVLDDGVTIHEDLPDDRVLPGYDFWGMDNNAAPGYYQGHGMGCAGLIAASHCTDSTRGGCDSTGIISMAPVSLVMPIKIFPDEPDDTTQHGILLSNLCAAIDSAWKWGADVLSNSWSCADPYQAPIPSLEMALGRAYTQGRHGRGCPVVFAAGNFGDQYPDVVSYPARIDTCFAVGASTLGDTLWDYSCYGLDLDITAPSGYICFGGDVFSLDQMGWFGYNWGGGYDTSMCNGPDLWERCEDVDYNCYHGGTSAACPLVAGAAALLIARDTTLTAPQIYRILDSSSVPVVPFPRRDTLKYDWGRLDAFRALLAITRGDANNDGQKNVGDATYIINYVWRGGPPPKPHLLTGDANCDGETTNADAVYMVNYVFHGGPAPKICFDYGS